MRYTISEMASLLGVTTHTLRYYEKMGLIRPEVNEETGYRYYTVTDTRRFNLCRELRAAELSLEECRELIGSPSVEQSDKMFARQATRLRRRQVLDELSIHFLEKMQEQYRTLEQDVGRVWVQNFPEMWRLTFSQEEEASRDRELQQEKAEWLECMPAARWVSRLPRRVMEQFRVGRNEYDYGLMMEADAACSAPGMWRWCAAAIILSPSGKRITAAPSGGTHWKPCTMRSCGGTSGRWARPSAASWPAASSQTAAL